MAFLRSQLMPMETFNFVNGGELRYESFIFPIVIPFYNLIEKPPIQKFKLLKSDPSTASSGMGVADDCKNIFLELQRKKTHRYVIFKIDEKQKEVIVEKVGDAAESYDDFVAALPENDCRYAVYDFDFFTQENVPKSKIFFIAWSPSIARIRAKMLYAASKDRFRREMDGVHYEIQATDLSEMDLETFKERAH